MAGRKITVEFLGESKDLQNAIGDVDGKSSKLGATLGKVGKAAALGLGAGLAVGGVALFKMTQGAIEDEAAQARLAKQLENSAGATKKQVAATEEWISKQGIALGVTDDELRPALEKLVTATGDVGQAQKLAALAMDVSAGSGKSLDAVSTALMKAQNGQVSGLARLGIETKNAAGETLTFEQATKAMADTFGGQAATQAGTLDGKMARLKLIMAEAGETIGSKLIPVVTQMADWFLNKGLPAIQKFGDWIGTHILPVLQKFGSDGSSIFTKVRNAMEPVIQTVLSIAQKIGNNLRPVFDQLVDTFKSKVLPTLNLIIDRFQEWWPTISKVVSKIADLGSTIIGKVLPPVIQFAGFLLSKLVPVILDAVEVLAKIIAKVYAVGAAFVGGVADVARFVAGVSQKIANVLQIVSEIPGKVLGALGAVGKTLYNAGSAIIQGLIDGIMAKVEVLKSKLREITNMIPDLKGPLDKDKILLKPAGEALIEGLISGIEKKKTKLQTVLEKITEHIKKEQDKLASLLDNRQSIVDSFKGFASSVFGADMGFEASADRQQKIQDLLERIKERRATGNEQDIADQKEIERLRSEGQEAPSRATADREKKIQDLLEKIKERQTTELDDADRKEIARLQAEDAAAPKGIDALMAAAATQRSKAETLNADVQALIAKGMSKDLINELIASGQSGMDQIHLLASATDEQIAALNANQAATQAALAAAGLAAADAVMGEQIAQAERDVKLADTIRDKLKELMEQQDKNTVIQVVLSGKTLHASLHKLKRETNRKLELD